MSWFNFFFSLSFSLFPRTAGQKEDVISSKKAADLNGKLHHSDQRSVADQTSCLCDHNEIGATGNN